MLNEHPGRFGSIITQNLHWDKKETSIVHTQNLKVLDPVRLDIFDKT